MKRIQSILLAVAMLLAAPAFFTSCQEDAPEINYTMNVSVINDFTKVVEAINNGALKNEEAIKKLTEAIDKMNVDQAAKLQAIADVLNSVNATLETKLAALDAAIQAQTLELSGKLVLLETAVKNQTLKLDEMGRLIATAIDNSRDELSKKLKAIEEIIKSTSEETDKKLEAIEGAIRAQTLSLETKLDLLTTAINNLPDYTAQLKAIKKAIKNLPDYTAQLAAIQAAIAGMPDYTTKFQGIIDGLGEMKTELQNLGTGQGNIVTAIDNATTEINNLVAAVNTGNIVDAIAFIGIIQKLEELKTAIENCCGCGGGGGSTMEFVDLGLSVKWAKCNIGASKPEGVGKHYAWGEIVPNKTTYTWGTYKWGTQDNLTKYNAIDGVTTLEAEDDIATKKLGSPCRMPTFTEIQELLNCQWKWITQDGVKGCEVKGPSGKTIFLPYTGYYRYKEEFENADTWGYFWSSSLENVGSIRAYYVAYGMGKSWGLCNRFCGFPVRAVRP